MMRTISSHILSENEEDQYRTQRPWIKQNMELKVERSSRIYHKNILWPKAEIYSNGDFVCYYGKLLYASVSIVDLIWLASIRN